MSENNNPWIENTGTVPDEVGTDDVPKQVNEFIAKLEKRNGKKYVDMILGRSSSSVGG